MSDSNESFYEKQEYLLYSQLYFGEKNSSNFGTLSNQDLTSSNAISLKEFEHIESQALDSSKSTTNAKNSNNRIKKKRTRRERNNSVSSIESISGKQILDELYCRVETPHELPTIQEHDLDCLPAKHKSSINRPNAIAPKNVNRVSIAKSRNDVKNIEICTITSSSSEDDVVVVPSSLKSKVDIINVPSSSSEDLEAHVLSKNIKKILDISKKLSDGYDSSSSSDLEELNSPPSLPLSYNMPKIYNSKVKRKSENCRKGREKRKFIESRVIYSKFRPSTKRNFSCPGYTQEMADLYDTDISEDLNVEEVHATQSDNPNLWKIRSEDRPQPMSFRYYREHQPKCSRCRELGHTEKNCPKVPVCPYCASPEHDKYYLCPHNCCLRCGGEPHEYCQKTSFSNICMECGMKGHVAELCPDLWRRYHLTIEGSKPVPAVELTNNNNRWQNAWCCNCAQKGHFVFQCVSYKQPQRFVIPPRNINSYDVPSSDSHPRPKKNKFEAPNTIYMTLKGGQMSLLKKKWLTQFFFDHTGCTVDVIVGQRKLAIEGEDCENARSAIKAVLRGKDNIRHERILQLFRERKHEMKHIGKRKKSFGSAEIVRLTTKMYRNFFGSHGGILPKLKSMTGCEILLHHNGDETGQMEITGDEIGVSRIKGFLEFFKNKPIKTLGSFYSILKKRKLNKNLRKKEKTARKQTNKQYFNTPSRKNRSWMDCSWN